MKDNKESLNDLEYLLKKTLDFIQNDAPNLKSDFVKSYLKKQALIVYEQACNLNEVVTSKPSQEHKIETPTERVVEKQSIKVEEKIETKTLLETPEPFAPPVKTVPISIVEPVKEMANKKPLISTEDDETKDEIVNFNEKISKNTSSKLNIADKHNQTPIKELSKAINISKKFEFINELFVGNAQEYKNIISKIDMMNNSEQAFELLSTFQNSKDWLENEKLADEFMLLVHRKFI